MQLDEDSAMEQRPTDAEVFSDGKYSIYFITLVTQRTARIGSLAIIAGADTTSNALTSILYFLCKYPKVYERLQNEIDNLGEEDMYDTQKQAHLHYLNAVMYVVLFSVEVLMYLLM
jgi:hypothetical protein